MPRLKPVGQAVTEALQFSRRLEARRGDIKTFELQRLARMACPYDNNRLLYLAKEMLVAEIERNFERFDAAASEMLAHPIGWDLAANMAIISMYAFNPDVSLQLARCALEARPDSEELIEFLSDSAWFCGDLALCRELRERIERLGGEMDKGLVDEEARRILADADVPLESYRQMVHGLHALVREHLAGAMNIHVEYYFDTARHEDGSESIVLEVLSNLDEDALDALDDAVLEYSSDINRWGLDLSRVSTLLVRDLPVDHSQGAA